MSDVFRVLKERGFIQQCTDEEAVARRLSTSRTVFYVGFDATANSLHAGSLLPIMSMAHLQRAGHCPIAIIGGGTTMVGDPSGKAEMRQMLSREQIEANGTCILGQLQRYLELDQKNGLFLNNADWLLPLNYIDFLREIGKHFRVNEMLRMEAYRQRLEREEGLSFIEFNYQLLQAYDFLLLFQRHGCELQMGGDDQWGNILAGIELIRKIEKRQAYGLTFPLLTTVRGEKMGKTAGGAIWLSHERTSPYDFYQYWINTDDRDVARFLSYFTFLPMDEVRRLAGIEGAAIREAKEVLAFEVTKLAHGEDEATRARTASRAAFSQQGDDLSAIPTSSLEADRLASGVPIVDLLIEIGFADSKSAARRLLQQGGVYVNGNQVTAIDMLVNKEFLEKEALILRRGKKQYHRIVIH